MAVNARLPACRRASRRHLRGVALAAWLALTPVLAAAVDTEEQLALRVKAALMFNVIKFVAWPDAKLQKADTPIRVCVLEAEAEPFATILGDTVRGKTIDGHPLISDRSTRASELRDCHLVYVAGDDPARVHAALTELQGSSALVVYEHDETLREGTVRLLLVERKLRFEINAAAAERENLQISSKLLSLSIVVRR